MQTNNITFETMFAAFVLNHCFETSDGNIVGDSFKNINSTEFKQDFNRLIELFLTQKSNEDYSGRKVFDKQSLLKQISI